MLKEIMDFAYGTAWVRLVTAEPGPALTCYMEQGVGLEAPKLTAPLTVEGVIRPGKLKRLLRLAEERGDRVDVLEVRGLRAVAKGAGRRAFFWLLLLSLCAAGLYIPHRVWVVTVEGNEVVSSRHILTAAENCGIHFWAKSKEIRSEKMKNRLLNLIPELEWAGVNFSGGIATITVRERVEAEQIKPRNVVTDIVAERDGIIVELSVLDGQTLCKVGQAVRAGDLLVSGCVVHDYKAQLSYADAEIYALTQHEIQAVTPVLQWKKVYTGRQVRCRYLLIGRKRINLSGNSGISGATCDKMTDIETLTLPGGYGLPVKVVTEVYREYTLETVEPDLADCEALLTEFGQALVTHQMLAGTVLDAAPVLTPEDGFLCMDAVYSCREMIARQKSVKLFEGEIAND